MAGKGMNHGVQMVFFGLAALLLFLVSVVPGVPLAKVSVTHGVLAVGVMPLIMGAVIHFTPALTRTGLPPWPVLLVPSWAMLAGVMAVWAMNVDFRFIWVAAPLGMGAAGILLFWLVRRTTRALAGYHPGILWYQAALAALLLSLGAIVASYWFPEIWPKLRSFHLHLNLMGFVGMTAIGTLQVLIPTVAGYGDPDAARRLHVDLKYAALGSFCSALGAAWLRYFSWFGLIFWMIPLVRLTAALWRHRQELRRAAGAALPLLGAVFGFYLLMLSGLLIGFRLMGPENTIPVFFVGFLFPLVSGALAWLVPVWLRPGAQEAERARLRQALVWGGGMRAGVFAVAAVLIAAGQGWAVWVAGGVMALFVAQVGGAVVKHYALR